MADPKVIDLTLDRLLHVITILSIVVGATVFITEIRASNRLLGEKLATISIITAKHEASYGHDGVRQHVAGIEVSVGKLSSNVDAIVKILDEQASDIKELESKVYK